MSKSNRWARHVSPGSKMVLVRVLAKGPLGVERDLHLVLDTGTPVTIFSTKVARRINLTEELSVGPSRLMGPTGPQDGYRVLAPEIQVLGRALQGFEIHCHELEQQLHVEGVLGLDVLRQGELRLNLPLGLVQFEWAT